MISEPLKIVVWRKLPSLNALFAMGHWQRSKEKSETQTALLSALQLSGSGSSIQITVAQSILSTAYDTLACYLTTDRKTSSLRLRRPKSKRKRKSGRKSN